MFIKYNKNTRHRLWGIYTKMIYRCHNSKCPDYHKYGARGIYVCDEWRESFERFCEDIGPRLSATLSLDRIDNDGPYSKANCRWTDRVTQAVNRRSTRFITKVKHNLANRGKKQCRVTL